MLTLVTTLLDVNAIDSGKINFNLDNYDLVPIIQSLLLYYKKATTKKNITIHFETSNSYHSAFVDENIARQILDNLISNAIKYSPLEKDIYIRLIDTKDAIRCEIKDNGPGLSQDDLSKLFSKFARLKPQPTAGEHSTGLGLFIVKKLVQKMYGKVWCESELGKGSKFVVEFVRGE
jgi:signal transduction histidine kinase